MNRILKLSAHDEFGYAKMRFCEFGSLYAGNNCPMNICGKNPTASRISTRNCEPYAKFHWMMKLASAAVEIEDFRLGQTFEVAFLLKNQEFSHKIDKNQYMLPIPKFATWKFPCHGSTKNNSNYRHAERAR